MPRLLRDRAIACGTTLFTTQSAAISRHIQQHAHPVTGVSVPLYCISAGSSKVIRPRRLLLFCTSQQLSIKSACQSPSFSQLFSIICLFFKLPHFPHVVNTKIPYPVACVSIVPLCFRRDEKFTVICSRLAAAIRI